MIMEGIYELRYLMDNSLTTIVVLETVRLLTGCQWFTGFIVHSSGNHFGVIFELVMCSAQQTVETPEYASLSGPGW